MMSNGDVDPRLVEIAEKLSTLVAALPHDRLGDLLDLTAGGLASLTLARQHRYQDRPEPLPKDYYEKLCERVERMAAGTVPSRGRWISGYHFNSAIFRIAAVRVKTRALLKGIDRQNKQREGQLRASLPDTDFDQLHNEYRELKHGPAGLAAGRQVTFDLAVEALQEVIAVLDARKSELADPRTRFPKAKASPRTKKRA